MCNCTVHQEPRKVLLHNCQGMSKRPAAAPRTHLNAAANRLTTKESWRKVRLRAEKRSKPCWELERASNIFATPSLAMFVKFRFILETNLLLHKSNAMEYKGFIQTAMITPLCKRISADWFQEIIVTDLSKVMTGTFFASNGIADMITDQAWFSSWWIVMDQQLFALFQRSCTYFQQSASDAFWLPTEYWWS